MTVVDLKRGNVISLLSQVENNDRDPQLEKEPRKQRQRNIPI